MEHKSQGRDLDRAGQQARDYFSGLQDHELPKYILVSDFARFRRYDLDEGTEHELGLAELHQHLHLFAFLTGYQKRGDRPEDPANIRAAELMGRGPVLPAGRLRHRARAAGVSVRRQS